MRSLLPALLLVTLLLAGCGGLAGGPTTAETPAGTDTATAGPTTDASTRSTTRPATPTTADARTTMGETTSTRELDGDRPPGIGEDGIANRTRLVTTNRRVIRTRGADLVAWQNVSVDGRNHTVSRQVLATMDAGQFPFHVVERRAQETGFATTDEVWANETIHLDRYRRNGSTNFTYHTVGNPEPPYRNPTDVRLNDLISLGEYERVEDVGSGPNRRITLRASTLDDTPDNFVPDRENLTGYRGVLVVDGDGLIRSLNVTVESRIRGHVVTEHHTYAVRDLGNQEVPQPSWVRSRIDEELAVFVTAELVEDRFIRLQNVGQEPIPSESRIQLWWAACGRSETRLDAPLAPGDTIYVYVDADQDSRLGVNRSGPAGPARELDDPDDITVYRPGSEYSNPFVRANVAVGTGASGDVAQSSRDSTVARLPVSPATATC